MNMRVPAFITTHLFSILFTLIIGGTTLAALFHPDTTLALRYDLAAIQQGQIWRLLTGHLVHSNTQHALLNLAGLWLIASLFERNARAIVWIVLTVLMACVSSIGFWLFKPEMTSYVGFSGVLHGLFFIAAISEWPRDRLVAGALALFLAGKLILTQFMGPSASTEAMIGVSIAEIAHLLGAAQGIVLGWLFRRLLFLSWHDKPVRWVI